MDTEKIQHEQTPPARERFASMSDLHARYSELVTQDPMIKEREKITKMYNREDHSVKGRRSPNFGQFAARCDAAISMFEDAVSKRDLWCRVRTYAGKNAQQSATWSKAIEEAFYKYAIRTWPERVKNTRHDVRDMVLYGKGVEIWWNPASYRSMNWPVEDVFPNSGAGLCPDDWESVFVRRKYTMLELWELIREANDEEDDYSPDGWNVEAVKDFINYGLVGKEDPSRADRMSSSSAGPNDDIGVLLVHALVKEYDGSISHYVFPDSGVICQHHKVKEEQEDRYLKKSKGEYESISDFIAVRYTSANRSWYDTKSFAASIWTVCKFYDDGIARVIRAAILSLTVFFKSQNTDSAEMLQRLRDSEVQVLEPGEEIEVVQARVAGISEMATLIQKVISDSDSAFAISEATRGEKTAKQAVIEANQLDNKQAAQLRMFLMSDQGFVATLYKKWTNGDVLEKHDKYFRLFKQELSLAGIPEKAWEADSVIIEPYGSTYGSSMTGIIAALKEVMTALRFSPRSKGEWQAVKQLITAIVGPELVDLFLEEMNYSDASTQEAGMENEAFSNPDVNPQNFVVYPQQNHVVHMAMHLQDAAYTIDITREKFATYDSASEELKPIILTTASNAVIGLEHQLAHMEAHIAMYRVSDAASEDVETNIAAWNAEMRKIRLVYQAVVNELRAKIEKRAIVNREEIELGMKLQYKQAMHEEELRFTKALNDLKLGAAVEKAQTNLQVGRAKRSQELESQAVKNAAQVEAKKEELALQKAISFEKAKQKIKKEKSNENNPKPTES